VFIKTKEDYWIYPMLQSAGLIVAGIVGQDILIKKYKLKVIWVPKKTIKKTIISNFPIFVNQFLPTLYNNTSSFLLGIIGGALWLGIYDAIKKIIDLSIALLNIVSRVFFPFLNRKKEAFLKYKRLMLILSVIMIFCILLSHQLVFWYLNITYANAFYILLILAISIIGYVLYDIFGLNYFIIKRQDKFVMKNTIIASFIGFATAFPFIYFFGIFGAAINLCITRWLMGAGLMFKWLLSEKK
jgi:PST family polysaccharide transporter